MERNIFENIFAVMNTCRKKDTLDTKGFILKGGSGDNFKISVVFVFTADPLCMSFHRQITVTHPYLSSNRVPAKFYSIKSFMVFGTPQAWNTIARPRRFPSWVASGFLRINLSIHPSLSQYTIGSHLYLAEYMVIEIFKSLVG